MIDEMTRKNTVNDVRNGISYLQAAKIHGVEDTTVKHWCHAAGVRSLHADKRNTDKEVIKTIMLHKAITCRELAKTLRYTDSGLNKRLRIMMKDGKIQSFRIPPLSHAAHSRGVLTKFINTRIYYVSKKDLAEWVRNQLPEEVQMSLRKYVTHIFRSIGIQIFVEAKK